MAAPTIDDLAAQLKGKDANDPELVRCHAAAMAWARKTIGVAANDTLAFLDDDNAAAILGYAGDCLKLPRATFGMFAPDDIEGLQVVAGDIGKRWSGQLLFGHRTRSSFA
jgi:hypothetical protein